MMIQTGLLALTALCGAQPARAGGGCRAINYGTIPVEMVGGRATTMATINGKDTRFIIDTGAFYNIMPRATADALGLHLEMAPPGFYITGLGGSTGAWLTRVKEFGIVGAKLPDITFIVGGTDMGMGLGLLGAPLLNLFDLEADLGAGKMMLIKPTGCSSAAMAYWSPGNYNEAKLLPPEDRYDRKSRVTVFVNGKPVRALLDTGAHTGITRKAALRVGIDMDKAEPSGEGGGIGSHHYKTWVARVDSYAVGTETIQNSRMRVLDTEGSGEGAEQTEMWLGADFFLSHHIYFANSQRKMYFTYNGGRVSQLDRHGAANAPDTVAVREPGTAQEFGLRGQARLERSEVAGGIADLTRAIAMAPQEPSSAVFYYARARGRMSGEGQTPGQGTRVSAVALDGALADLDMALRLAPNMADPLVMRARLRMLHHEEDLARADLDTLVRLLPPGAPQTQAVASMLIATDQPARALPLLDNWVKLHSDDGGMGSMLNQRCWARGLAGTALEGAQEDCRKAIKLNGESAAYLDSQALVELRLGHNQAALDEYTKVLAENPGMAWSRYGMAVARLRLGQMEQGKVQLAAVKASNPDVVARAARFGLTPP